MLDLAADSEPFFVRIIIEVIGLTAFFAGFWWLARIRPVSWTRRIDRRLAPLRAFARRPLLPSLAMGLAAFAGCVVYAAMHGLSMPLVTDEFAYLLAADTFSQGHLTNPPHAMWRHFEALNVLQQPTYQSKHPPGQALLLAAGQLLGHPVLGVWIGIALMAGSCTWMLRAWVSPGWALVGGWLPIVHYGLGFRWAHTYWGGALTVAGAALALGGARRTFAPSPGSRAASASMLGLGLGILALTRPYEGLVASLPLLALAGLWVVGRSPGAVGRPRPRTVVLVALATGATLFPCLAFQGLLNQAITGDALRFPHRVYAERYWILDEFVPLGVRELPDDIPEEMAAVAEMRLNRDHRPGALWVGPREAWRRTSTALFRTLGVCGLLVVLVGASRWIRHPWMRFAACGAAVSLSAHLVILGFFDHYFAPSVAWILVLGTAALRAVDGIRRGAAPVGRALVAAALLVQVPLAVWSLAQPAATDFWQQERRSIEARLKDDRGRHLVFVRYGPFHIGAQEWVYNDADLDADPVIWARDLGDESNRALMESMPERTAWIVEVDAVHAGPQEFADESAPIAVLTPYPDPSETDSEPNSPTVDSRDG